MSFLRNGAINRVNVHSGVQALAQGAGGIFFLVFLIRAGLSVPAALLAQSAILAVRFALRPAILPLARRWGLKPLVIAGTIVLGLQYPILAEVKGIDGALLALCLTAAVGEILYWPSYNAYFAAVGLVQVLAAMPLVDAPDVSVKAAAPGALRWARPGVAFYALDAWFDASFYLVWPVALFLTLDESFAAYGGAMALAALAGAACGLLVGRIVDAGRGRRAVAVACSAAAAVILLRSASLDLPWLAVVANALGAVVMPLLIPVLGAATYNLAKASPCPFRFVMAAEAGWDLGCIAGCLSAAALVAAGVPLGATLLLALPGTAVMALLLRRHYGGVLASAVG